MDVCLPATTLHLPSFSSSSSSSSSSSQRNNHYGDKARELFGSIASQVFFQALFLIFIFQFGVVGSAIGAFAGGLIGFNNKGSFLQDVIKGAVSGAVLSHKVIKAAFDHLLHSEDHANVPSFFLHLVEILAGDLGERLLRDRDHVFLISKVGSCEKLIKLPKIEISQENILDASGNANCCSICLQDFEVGNVGGSFPKCGHMFHPPCISKWLLTHSSCPVCRASL